MAEPTRDHEAGVAALRRLGTIADAERAYWPVATVLRDNLGGMVSDHLRIAIAVGAGDSPAPTEQIVVDLLVGAYGPPRSRFGPLARLIVAKRRDILAREV